MKDQEKEKEKLYVTICLLFVAKKSKRTREKKIDKIHYKKVINIK